MRRTAQREMVYNAIVRLGGHCTAEQITEELHQTKPGFPRSTVYRALEALTASGSVYAAHLGEGPTHYELASGDHHHAVCQVSPHDFPLLYKFVHCRAQPGFVESVAPVDSPARDCAGPLQVSPQDRQRGPEVSAEGGLVFLHVFGGDPAVLWAIHRGNRELADAPLTHKLRKPCGTSVRDAQVYFVRSQIAEVIE